MDLGPILHVQLAGEDTIAADHRRVMPDRPADRRFGVCRARPLRLGSFLWRQRHETQ